MNDIATFAATPIQPPRPRAARLARPRLEAALLHALPRSRPVLLQAPGAFGKRSALVALLARLPDILDKPAVGCRGQAAARPRRRPR